MKIKYKNFEIEQDRSCYIVTEYGLLTKGKNQGTIGELDQFYPMNLENALISIQHRILRNKQDKIELGAFLEELRKINKEFIEDIKNLIK